MPAQRGVVGSRRGVHEIQLDDETDSGEHAAVENEDDRSCPGCLARSSPPPGAYPVLAGGSDHAEQGGGQLEQDCRPD
jgi:hypothetical protein